MRVIIVAGGTGGHIYPALAILNKIKKEEKESNFLYIGTTDRMEKEIIPKKNIPYIGIPMQGLNRKYILKNIKVLNKYRKAYYKAKQIIKEFNPDIVIGVGGYITSPVLKAAHTLHYKTIIHEQNSYPGLSNKILSKKVDKILVSLPETINFFPKEKTVYTGNPRSEEIALIKKGNKQNLHFSADKKLVIIVMGSLGSKTINKKLLDLMPAFQTKNYEVLVITGNAYYEEYKKINIPSNVKICPFIDNLIEIMKVADLIISRAGASTIAEITTIGLPSILVPSPYVTNNHQLKNAKELEKVGACVILEEKNFSEQSLLQNIDEILNNKEKYRKMQQANKKLGVTDSATRVYNEIKKLVKGEFK